MSDVCKIQISKQECNTKKVNKLWELYSFIVFALNKFLMASS